MSKLERKKQQNPKHLKKQKDNKETNKKIIIYENCIRKFN